MATLQKKFVLVDDPSPQLGANLDMNGHNIGGNTEAQIDDAVAKKHTQGTDTTLGAMTADVNMNTHKITGVVDPVANQEAATKKYVDDNSINNIVEDITPQLGADLDLNGKNIDFPSTANVSDVKDEDNMASDSATMLATQQSIKAFGEGLVTIIGVAGTKVADITEVDTNWHFLDLSAYVTTRCTAVVLIASRMGGVGSFFVAPYESTLDAPVSIYGERALFDIKDGGQRIKYRQSAANDDFDVYLMLKMDSE